MIPAIVSTKYYYPSSDDEIITQDPLFRKPRQIHVNFNHLKAINF